MGDTGYLGNLFITQVLHKGQWKYAHKRSIPVGLFISASMPLSKGMYCGKPLIKHLSIRGICTIFQPVLKAGPHVRYVHPFAGKKAVHRRQSKAGVIRPGPGRPWKFTTFYHLRHFRIRVTGKKLHRKPQGIPNRNAVYSRPQPVYMSKHKYPSLLHTRKTMFLALLYDKDERGS